MEEGPPVRQSSREVVSHGRIEFDEDGEPVAFEETRWRRDGATILPLSPAPGGSADGSGVAYSAVGNHAAPIQREICSGGVEGLVGGLDTFEKHRQRDWLGFVVRPEEERQWTAEEAYRRRTAAVRQAIQSEWSGWLQTPQGAERVALAASCASAGHAATGAGGGGGYSSGPRASAEEAALLSRLVWAGVPHEMRPRVWPLLCGAEVRTEEEAATASSRGWDAIIQAIAQSEAAGPRGRLALAPVETLEQIEKDVRRTFARNDHFCPGEEGRAQLSTVLLAYAMRSEAEGVGYAQSMNFLGGLCVLVCGRAERAFALLATLVEAILPPQFYAEDMSGVQTEVAVLLELARVAYPNLLEHLDSLGCGLEAFAVPWFSCLFVPPLSLSAVFTQNSSLFDRGVLLRIISRATAIVRTHMRARARSWVVLDRALIVIAHICRSTLY